MNFHTSWEYVVHIYATTTLRVRYYKIGWSKGCLDGCCAYINDSCYSFDYYNPISSKLKEGILVSHPPSVCPSVRPSLRLSVHSSVDRFVPLFNFNNTSQIHFILHIWSSSFRRWVACKGCCKFQKWEFLIFFFKFRTLTLFCFDLGSNMNQ